MTSSLYRTPPAEVTADLSAVRARYDRLGADVATVRGAGVSDPAVSAAVAPLVFAEARWLDGHRWQDWLAWCDDDTMVWVPLDVTHPAAGDDQSLFLDDRRRLDERVWRFGDPFAWALVPGGTVVRSVTAVEAWPCPAESGGAPDEVLVSSSVTIQYVRLGSVWTTSGHQIHRLRARRLVHKILLLPALSAGTPHLGWLM